MTSAMKIKPLESDIDEDYEGLLSSYLESDAWKKMVIHEYSSSSHMLVKLADDEEKT